MVRANSRGYDGEIAYDRAKYVQIAFSTVGRRPDGTRPDATGKFGRDQGDNQDETNPEGHGRGTQEFSLLGHNPQKNGKRKTDETQAHPQAGLTGQKGNDK